MGRNAKLVVFGDPKDVIQNGTQYRVATHYVMPAQHSEDCHMDPQEHVDNPVSRACGRQT